MSIQNGKDSSINAEWPNSRVRRLAVIEAVLHGPPVATPRFAHIQRAELGRALEAELASLVHVGGQGHVDLAFHVEAGGLPFGGEVFHQPPVRHAAVVALRLQPPNRSLNRTGPGGPAGYRQR